MRLDRCRGESQAGGRILSLALDGDWSAVRLNAALAGSYCRKRQQARNGAYGMDEILRETAWSFTSPFT
jgi:hypothetical protein